MGAVDERVTVEEEEFFFRHVARCFRAILAVIENGRQGSENVLHYAESPFVHSAALNIRKGIQVFQTHDFSKVLVIARD